MGDGRYSGGGGAVCYSGRGSGYSWLRMATAGYGWLRLATAGYVWLRRATYGYGWRTGRMESDWEVRRDIGKGGCAAAVRAAAAEEP